MKAKYVKEKFKMAISITAVALALTMTACGNTKEAAKTSESSKTQEESAAEDDTKSATYKEMTEADITIKDTAENTADGEHAIEADGTKDEYANIKVNKTGDSEGDEADFYGENAAVFATNGATLDLSEMYVTSNGEHANGVFSYGEGTTVNVSDSLIETENNCSGGLMTTGGGTMNADNVTIHTKGNSSAAIRSDRGGGTVSVKNSYATTDGTGSPAIYSTADITVNDSYLESTASQGVVVEGSNSVTLNNVDMVADNNQKNSDKSDTYQAVMIYQSMSGDTAEGQGQFTMDGGTLTNKNGDLFFVNNTVANISLSDVSITNEDSDGVILRAEAAGWGKEGSNGGQVNLTAKEQTLEGDMIVDDVSALNLYLQEKSALNGAINPDGAAGDVYVEIASGATWKLTGDSYVTSLTCDKDAIDLNGHKLYVDGKEYEEGSASEGEAIKIEVKESSGQPGGAPGEMPGGEKPEGGAPDGSGDKQGADKASGGQAPDGQAPDGQAPSGEAPSGNPPEKPDGAAPDGNGGPQGNGNPPQGNPPEKPAD